MHGADMKIIVVNVKSAVLWDKKPCSLVNSLNASKECGISIFKDLPKFRA